MQYRTILIGEQIETMRKLAQAMMQAGISTHIAGSTASVLNDFPHEQVDAVVIGRYLAKRKARAIVKGWQQRKAGAPIIFIKVPIGELVSESIKAALFEAGKQEPIMSSLSLHKRSLSFSTTATSSIEVVLYRYTLTLRTRIYRVYNEQHVLSGRQIIVVPQELFGFGGERFIVITVNGTEKHVFPIH